MRARYRNKLKKVIIEIEYQGKWYYVKTLGDPSKEFFKECLDKVSFLEEQNKNKFEKENQQVPIINIRRTPEEDKNKTLSKEEIEKLAFELSK